MKAVSFLGFAIAFLVVSTSAEIRENYLMPENGDRSVDHSKPDLKTMFGQISIDTAASRQWKMVINRIFDYGGVIPFSIKLRHAESSRPVTGLQSDYSYDFSGAIGRVRVLPTNYMIRKFTSTVSVDRKFLNIGVIVGIDKVRVQHDLKLRGIWQKHEFDEFVMRDVLSVFDNVTISCSLKNIQIVRIIGSGNDIFILDMAHSRTPNCGLMDFDPLSISLKFKGAIIRVTSQEYGSEVLAISDRDLVSMIGALQPQFKSFIEKHMGAIFTSAFNEKTYDASPTTAQRTMSTRSGSKQGIRNVKN